MRKRIKETMKVTQKLEITQPTTIKKARKNTNINRREMTTDQEKELGIQTTLEEALRKEVKLGKSHTTHTKGVSSHPSKGGHKKM
jgi:hypothetical protein